MYQWQNQHALPLVTGWILVPSDPWRWHEKLLRSVITVLTSKLCAALHGQSNVGSMCDCKPCGSLDLSVWVSDCRSRGCEFDPSLAPYFRGDWSWNNFYGHSPPFRWFIQEVVVSYKREYVHELLVNRLFKPAKEKVWLGELTVRQWP